MAAKKATKVIDMSKEVPAPPDEEVLVPDAVSDPDGSSDAFVDANGDAQVLDDLPVQNDPQKRKLQALTLRLSGATYNAIANALNVNITTAKNYVRTAMAEISVDDIKTLRTIHHTRLETLLMRQWPIAMGGDIAATNTALGIMDRIDRLYGLSGADPDSGGEDDQGGFIILGDSSSEEYIDKLKRARASLQKGNR